jgi:hypothetical protein
LDVHFVLAVIGENEWSSTLNYANRDAGIALANDSLLEFHRKFPKAKLRIICISDGEDNMKSHLVHNLAAQLARDKVVVDSICLGM